MTENRPPLVAVVGTNASGKSELGVHLALRLGGEVVSADSRQVYRGLDIGSGKVTAEEARGVPHHLIDVCDPGRYFTLQEYQALAYQAIDGILARGRVPLLVGGTGLYVRAVVDGYEIPPVPPNPALRAELERQPAEAVARTLARLDPAFARQVDPRNKRRVIRAIEVLTAGYGLDDMRRRRPRYDTLRLGLTWPWEVLCERIDRRLRQRLSGGLIEEVKGLLAEGVSEAFLLGLGLEYEHAVRFLRGEYQDLEELHQALRAAIQRFARRQLSWFRRDPRVRWLDATGDYHAQAEREAERFLAARGR